MVENEQHTGVCLSESAYWPIKGNIVYLDCEQLSRFLRRVLPFHIMLLLSEADGDWTKNLLDAKKSFFQWAMAPFKKKKTYTKLKIAC